MRDVCKHGQMIAFNAYLLVAVDDTVSLITVLFDSSVVVLIKMPLSSLPCTASIFSVAVSIVVVVVVVVVLLPCDANGFMAIVRLFPLPATAAKAGSSGVSGVGKIAVFP